ncbi:conserved hypothetical protein [Paraburkholderia piptadeniae]|uniref:Uncharacterized protein n=2 Tax=Paraburkholderia TaxID=1822464 RepID=A0A7X1NLR5_9BURK|nr:hypothetical protein [Paraburkholderia franconis]SIT52129.1 conserved hypothetical protein [Paraburkholderia piptadeniae]
MPTVSYATYRGYSIDVHVTPARSHSLGGAYRRFRVSWTVSSAGDESHEVTSFQEKFDFLSEEEAFRYGGKRAHTFIDSILSTPSQRSALGEGNETSWF